MITAVLFSLIVADFIIVAAFLRLQSRQISSHSLVRELTEERAMLADLREQIRSELLATQSQVRTLRDQVQVLATEAEQEVKHGISEITKEVDSIISEVSQKLDGPMRALNEKQQYISQLSKTAKKESEHLAFIVSRAENVAKLLNAGGAWEDVVGQLEDRRLADIRALLVRGHKPERIAREIGVSEQEVRIISGTI
jgi:DNA anti-recombination protein RmuC